MHVFRYLCMGVHTYIHTYIITYFLYLDAFFVVLVSSFSHSNTYSLSCARHPSILVYKTVPYVLHIYINIFSFVYAYILLNYLS